MGQTETKEIEKTQQSRQIQSSSQFQRTRINPSQPPKLDITNKHSHQPSITKEFPGNLQTQVQIPIITKPFSSRPSLFPNCNTEPTFAKQQESNPQIETKEMIQDRSFSIENKNSFPKQKIIKNLSAASLPKQKPITMVPKTTIYSDSPFNLVIDLTDQIYPNRFSKPRPTNSNKMDQNFNDQCNLKETKKPVLNYDLLNISNKRQKYSLNHTPIQNFSNQMDPQSLNINQFFTDTHPLSNLTQNQKFYPSLFKSETTSEIRYPYCTTIDQSIDSERQKEQKNNNSLAKCYLSRRNTNTCDKENHYESIYSRSRSNNHIKNTKSQNNLHRFKEDDEDSREWVVRVNSRSKAEQLQLRKEMMSYGRKPSKTNTDTNSSVQENRGVNTTIYSNTIKEVQSPVLDRLVNGVKAKVPEKEMFALTKKNYYNLPEVKQKIKEEQKKIEKTEFLKERKIKIKELDKEIKNRLYKQR